jgi:hypothetical protein
MRRFCQCCLFVVLALVCATAQAQDAKPVVKITWKKTVVDPTFRSEGVCVVDVNKDGKADIIVGDYWYEAPKEKSGEWKRHVLRADRKYDPRNYSDSFCCFAEDFTGDGYPDVIVVPFPGAACYWYENPGSKGGMWKQHFLTNSACNETPQYVDLFKTGKKVLLMGWQPEREDKKGSFDDRGEMCWFTPGKDPTQPWERHSISGPSVPGKKEIAGTRRFSHGLGTGDVNGDGRLDVICTGGWWEQPAKDDGATPWTFHPANLGGGAADMHAIDIDGDGKADIVGSAPHSYGFWWYQHQAGKNGSPTFIQRELFPAPATLAKEPAGYTLSSDEKALFSAINKLRHGRFRKAMFAGNAELFKMARDHAERKLKSPDAEVNIAGTPGYKGKITMVVGLLNTGKKVDVAALELLQQLEKGIVRPGSEIGLAHVKGEDGKEQYTLVVGDRGQFSLPGATHALQYVDMDGDGLKDLVTGQRRWAHAPNAEGQGGDEGVNDPAYLYLFRAKKDKSGFMTFTPEVIDDASGVGTQFEIADINGDGIPDVIVSNKHGVFIFEQVRVTAYPAPPRRDE